MPLHLNLKHVLQLKSFSDRGDLWYTIDLEEATCSCPSFQRSKRRHCKHLYMLGVYKKVPYIHSTQPSFAQALSALVKSIRIRQPEEAVYWLQYLLSPKFVKQSDRFRVIRRVFQATAEDGMSVDVMEKTATKFFYLTKPDTPFLYVVAEIFRICKVPNWWADPGGQDFIYSSMMGRRLCMQEKWDKKPETAFAGIKKAIEEQNRLETLKWFFCFEAVKNGDASYTKQAEWLLQIAIERNHPIAQRLCYLHLKYQKILISDNNFVSQAAWYLAGGKTNLAEQIEPVTTGECVELIDKVQESWKTPHVLPDWCADGVHCAGNDVRFAGLLPQMNALCEAFKHYGKIDPADEWLPKFYPRDGLTIRQQG